MKSMATTNKKGKSFKKVSDSRQVSKLTDSTPSRFSEAYRAIRTNLIFALAAQKSNIVVFSSSIPSEGKSTTSSNLAVIMAQTGAKVLLIDADLRKPVQHSIFQVSNRVGLSTILAKIKDFTQVVHSEVSQNLDLVTSGPIPPNPSELLGCENMDEFLKQVSAMYDYVFVDMPPIGVVTDAMVLAPKTAGIVLASRQGITRFDVMSRVLSDIKFAGANILGVVFTESA